MVTTMTTTFDATPFTALPDNVPALPTGTYILPVTTPSVAPASCLVNSAQSSAWSCSIPPALPYQVSITSLSSADVFSNSEITIDYGNFTVDYLPYGAQPPIIKGPIPLRLVTDSKYPERGPAWFFQTIYDKVVILPEDKFSATNDKRDYPRDRNGDISGFMNRKGVAQIGDMPWFCYWNATLLEAFIYVNQTSNAGNSKSSAAASSGSASSSSPTPSSSGGSSAPTYYPSSDATYMDPKELPCYPKVVKLEERRVAINGQTITPYCVQHVVNGDGTYGPSLGADGLPVTVHLNETIPATVTSIGEKRNQYRSFEESDTLTRRQSDAVCGCVWLQQ